jgi:carbon storage regulator
VLVLTRKLGEGIAIGDSIKIVVMQIKGKQVRLGVQAAPSTPVHREEVYHKIKEENQLAQHTEPNRLSEFKNLSNYSVIPENSTLIIRKKKKDPHT